MGIRVAGEVLHSVLVDAIGEPAFVVDVDGIVVAWNEAAETFFGRKRRAAIGQRCPAIVMGRRPDGEFVCTLECPYIQGFGYLTGERAEELIVRTGERGVRRRVTRLHVPLGDAAGAPAGLLHIFIPADEAGEREENRPANGRTASGEKAVRAGG